MNAQQLLDKNLRHEVKAAEKLDHKRRKLVLKQREKDELAAEKKSLKENGAKVVEHNSVPPPLQTTGLSEEVSLLTAKVSVLKLPHVVLSILRFMCPQLTLTCFPCCHCRCKASSKARSCEQEGEVQDHPHSDGLEARVGVQSIDKAQEQAIAAQIKAANNAGSGGRGAPGLKRKPTAQAVTIPSVAQLEQASRRTRSAKQ